MDIIKYWLWLAMVFGSEIRTMWKVMRNFESVSDAYYYISSDRNDIKLSEKCIKNIESFSLGQAESLIEYSQKLGINVICYDSPEYPDGLRHISDPPAVLYYKGDISCVSGKKNIACVGTRKPSPYTLSVTAEMCRELAGYGFIIISGFAVGVDITSHLAAVSVNRPTACVLGCGIDVNYPSENFKFRDNIINSGGVFISEYPPGTPAYNYNFPRRNRILSALGRATIVFEAAKKSGSISTADISVEQGKELFCIPPSDITDERYAGNIRLLRGAAQPVYSCDEILDFFSEKCRTSDVPENVKNFSDKPAVKRSPAKRKKAVPEEIKPVVKKTEGRDAEKENDKYASLTPVQQKIVGMLEGCKLHIDIIAGKLDMDILDIMNEITELEFSGVVKQLPGKFFQIN